MHYPVNFGKWQRQAPQPHAQWIYKSTSKNLAQAGIDHITLQLAAATATATVTGLHYTTRGITIWGTYDGSGQVYNYDYVPNLATGVITRSNQMNHNENRFPKQYTSDTTAATAMFGAPKIASDALMLNNYNETFNTRGVNSEVADFWNSFPKFKISVTNILKEMTLKFTFTLRDATTKTVIADFETNATGHAIVYGYGLDEVEISNSGLGRGFMKLKSGENYASTSGSNYNFEFTTF